jgi:deaminated glutathione amidase
MPSNPSRILRASVVQSCATPDLAANLADLERRIREAAGQGATFISLPEACEFLHPDNQQFFAHARTVEESRAFAVFAQLAAELQVWLLIGSLSVRLDEKTLANRGILLTPEGKVRASYDKIHLFDAAPGEKPSLESRLYRRGDKAFVVDIGTARIGLSICYDLRFPQLYRALAQQGAEILMVPSAFMQITGEAHWHTLLRARAIETGCFVMAPAQCGVPHEGRESFGHSLIVSPWGEVIADVGREPGIAVADLDLAEVAKARRRIPSLTQNFEFSVQSL